MLSPRKLGGIFVIAGALLVAVYAVPTVSGAALAHLELARFRASTPTHRAWDSARIRAYERTLDHDFDRAVPPPEAVLRIPRLGLEVPVLEGVSNFTLNRAVGHIPGTALPATALAKLTSMPENIAITGHRDGFFRPLKDIVPGDIITLDAAPASNRDISNASAPAPSPARYLVRSTRVVPPSDTSVLQPTSGSTLTLITCFPFYFVGAAPQRFVVQASLLPPTSPQPNPGD